MIDYTPTKRDTVGSASEELYTLVTHLRSKNGCPWDREQKSIDVATNMIGEVYELLDALNNKDKAEESEELGDVLLNVFLLLRIALEDKGIDPINVLNDEVLKIYSRHPHVFGDEKVKNSAEVLTLWSKIKEKEGKVAQKDDFFSRIPKSEDPYTRASELHKKVRKVGFEWDSDDGVFNKVHEELSEVEKAVNEETFDDVEMECGDLIFASIALCTRLHVHPENAIRRSCNKFEKRFNAVVKKANEQNIPLDKEHFAKMDALWDEVKKCEKNGR